MRLGTYREPFDANAVANVRMAGANAGYTLDTAHRTPTSRSTVVVKRLRTGRDKYKLPGFTGTPAGAPDLYSVTDLELKPNGAVGWIVVNSQGARRVEVRKADADGRGVVVDSGEGIELHSLAVSGSTLYWMKNGRANAVTLR